MTSHGIRYFIINLKASYVSELYNCMKWSTGNNVLMDSTAKSIDYLAIEWFNRIYVGCLSKSFNIAKRLEIYFLIGGKIAATT